MTNGTPAVLAPSSDQSEICAEAQGPAAGPGYSLPTAALKAIVLGIMLVLTIALLWFPVKRINCDSEINYNEGWNAYKQAMVAQGVPLYDAPPDPLTGPTTYPPLSFHIIRTLAGRRDLVRTGRWVSLVSLIVTGVFIGLIVRELGADAVIAAFSTLLWILGISILLPDRLGMNDPQLLGEALTTAGLYLYVKSRRRTRLLCASALLFCLAGFTKQNLLAFPIAAAVDLLMHSRRRRFSIWMGAMIFFAAALTGLTLAVDGRYFFDHLLFHRAYSLGLALTSITQSYLVIFQSVVLVALVWTLCRFRSSPLLATAFLAANVLAFVLSGGDGVDLNIFFNAIAAAVMIVGFALGEIERGVGFAPSPEKATGILHVSGSALSAALMAGLFLFVAMSFPDRLQDDHDEARLLSSQDTAFRSAAALIRQTPGPAICENLLLCYRAGKPYAFDAFVTTDELETRRLNRNTIPALLRHRQFGAVELDTLPAEADSITSPLIRRRPRFSGEAMDALQENYNLNMRTPEMLIFVAK